MCSVDEILKMRDMYFIEDLPLAKIGKLMGRDWRTIKKYVEMDDFSPKKPHAEET